MNTKPPAHQCSVGSRRLRVHRGGLGWGIRVHLWLRKRKGPPVEPEGRSVEPEGSCPCEREKFGPSEWPLAGVATDGATSSSSQSPSSWQEPSSWPSKRPSWQPSSLLAFEPPSLSLLTLGPLSSQALSSTATHHPYAADYREAGAGPSTDECHFGNFFLKRNRSLSCAKSRP